MPSEKRLVCLANSRKLNGRCIAGREVLDGGVGGWVRPVNAREHEEVSEYERQYQDGSDPRVRDIFDLTLVEPRPKTYQQENWLLEPRVYWVKRGRATWRQIEELEEPDGTLWIDGYHTFNGVNDEIPIDQADALTSSLRLIRVEAVTFSVFAPGEAFGNPKRRVQAKFFHAGQEYRLWVTDPTYETRYLAQPDGEYGIDGCFLTVSLGEPFRGCANKLVAAVIERGGGGAGCP